ncbi:unnamed protein product, partial [Vitis vinifera]|uniref:Uncharacterized protein n=1 Tax=Vitis vinifera TaxID=29760 RepID=D7SZN2_VITVI
MNSFAYKFISHKLQMMLLQLVFESFCFCRSLERNSLKPFPFPFPPLSSKYFLKCPFCFPYHFACRHL